MSDKLGSNQWLSPSIVWRRFFPRSSGGLSFSDVEKMKKKDVELIADLFHASIFSENASFSQLRMCQLSNKQTQILATLVPDEIIHFQDLRKQRTVSFVGVLLFADVSGFTALTEKYSAAGKGGTYRLTATLNEYIGSMVEVIYSHGGDVLNFAGDAFLALWKVKPSDYLAHVVHNVISCAVYIQKALGSYETDVKVLLKVKVAISAGNIIFSVIGDDLCQQFIVCGSPIEDVNTAEHLCTSGDIIVSPSAWGHCSPHNYEFSWKMNGHVKISKILYTPQVSKKDATRKFAPLSEVLEPRRTILEDKESLFYKPSVISAEFSEKYFMTNSVLRPSVAYACKEKIGGVLRPFILPPVVQQIDADQPLQYLTEMRQVTTMFVNLVPEKISSNLLVQVVDEAYTTIYKIVRPALGCINKVTMFDKDITFLIIFGLRGCKYELESENGLKCAYSVLNSIRGLRNIISISAGVTTGMVYCGVVGHNARREYTVIGAPVNKAARLMCAYRGQVTCDYITLLQSKLPSQNFELEENKKLKGIDTVGKLYKYEEFKKDSVLPRKGQSFFGREDIISMFENMLENFPENVSYNSLVIQGDTQMGKSCLLNELIKKISIHEFVPIPIYLNDVHLGVPFITVYFIFTEILGINDTSTLHDRAECILDQMNDSAAKKELCYLNEILQVKFPHSEQYLQDSPAQRMNTLNTILQKFLLEKSEKFVIAIDDAHFVDNQSWEVLTNLTLSKCIYLVATMNDGEKVNTTFEAQTFLTGEQVKVFKLQGLESHHVESIACQFLNVTAISSDLQFYLKKYGSGNPGWCQSFLSSLIHSGSLEKKKMSVDEFRRKYLHKTDMDQEEISADSINQKELLSELKLSFKQDEIIPVCVIRSDYRIKRDAIPQTIDAMIMTIFDSLSPYEQLLVKCSSVLGDTFTRTMLLAIMHRPSPFKTAEALKRLFELHVYDCVYTYSRKTSEKGLSMLRTQMTESEICCFCPDVKGEILRKQFPKYAFCQAIHFKISLFRITTYELLPVNQKKYFHERAVQFLEEEDAKCISCGGKGLFIMSPQDVENNGPATLSPSFEMIEVQNLKMNEGDSDESSENSDISTNKKEIVDQDIEPEYLDEKILKNFKNCECHFVMIRANQQLVYHSMAAGMKDKQVKFLTEQGALSIMIGNNVQAIKVLNRVKTFTEQNGMTGEMDFGDILTLLGQANLDKGNLNEAKSYLTGALRKYEITFPRSRVLAHLLFRPWYYYYLKWQNRHLKYTGLNKENHLGATALSHLTNVFMMEEKWLFAELSALMSLNFSLRTDNFCGLCEAFSNMMEICHHYKRLKHNKKLEESALSFIRNKVSGSTAKDLQSLCHLFWAITVSRLLRGELTSSVKMGLLTKKISDNLHNNFITLTILPILIQEMLMNGHFHETVDLLNVLKFEAQTDVDKSSEIWYYALCFDILLDTGFRIETAHTCILYCQQLYNAHKEKFLNIVYRDKASVKRLATCMWIWYIRMRNDQQCCVWGNITKQHSEDSFSEMATKLRYLEGLLTCTAIELNLTPAIIQRFHQQAKFVMETLEKTAVTCTVIQPRLLHLKAYYTFLQNNTHKALEILNLAKQRAEEQKNILELGWINHTLRLWTGKINSLDERLWEEVVFDSGMVWQEYDDKSSVHISFSFPTPKHHY